MFWERKKFWSKKIFGQKEILQKNVGSKEWTVGFCIQNRYFVHSGGGWVHVGLRTGEPAGRSRYKVNLPASDGHVARGVAMVRHVASINVCHNEQQRISKPRFLYLRIISSVDNKVCILDGRYIRTNPGLYIYAWARLIACIMLRSSPYSSYINSSPCSVHSQIR